MTYFCPVAPSHEPEWALLGSEDGPVFVQAAWTLPIPRMVGNRLLIIDNQHPISATGGETVSSTPRSKVEHLFEVASHYQNIEIVIPDELEDCRNTLHALSDVLHWSRSWNYTGRFMFVPQGKNVAEWLACLGCAIHEYGHLFHTIGVPMHLERYIPRHKLIHHIPVRYAIHMLGVWNNIDELSANLRVRSWDTSLPISAAQARIHLPLAPGDPKPHLTQVVVPAALALTNICLCRRRLGDDNVY